MLSWFRAEAVRLLTWALVPLPLAPSRFNAKEPGIARVVPADTPLERLTAPAMVMVLGLPVLLRLTLAGDAPDRVTPSRSVDT